MAAPEQLLKLLWSGPCGMFLKWCPESRNEGLTVPRIARLGSLLFQQTVHRGRADCEQLGTHFLRQGKMTVSFHRLDQFREKRYQSLRADTVGHMPELS